ncbi:glycosyltransferase family 2 protein [Candidatus Woesearchaeota archaeon]|nr:glycosyltransferase family 2 protein [Candidatus Woesearchaeota archaeon]
MPSKKTHSKPVRISSKSKAGKDYSLDDVWIVIPAFNEESKIANVVSAVKEIGFLNTVVIDDGSKDNTYEQAKTASRHVIRQKKNMGQGAALRDGINYAINNGAKIVVTFDSDGQHRPQDLKPLIQPIIDGKCDVVLGSRFLTKDSVKKVPFVKRNTLRLGTAVCFLLYGIRLTDSQSGLRALSAKAAKKIRIREDRMEHAAEIFDEIMRHKLSFQEVPIVVNYTRYSMSKGQGSTAAFKLGTNMLKMKFRKR